MKTQLQERLKTLQAEFRNGQQALADLESRRENLRTTLLRISGAIQVLEELLPSHPPAAENTTPRVHEDTDESTPVRAYG
jgi:hypothetical protein